MIYNDYMKTKNSIAASFEYLMWATMAAHMQCLDLADSDLYNYLMKGEL